MKLAVALLLVNLVLGCASVPAKTEYNDTVNILGTEPYKIGPISVWIRPQEEVKFFCRLVVPNVVKHQKILGCYLPESKTIISIADPYVILHELKHYFEGKFHN